MRRDATPYAERREWVAPAGYGVSLEPQAGFYRTKLRSGSIIGGVHIWHGPPFDPDTGEEMDRSWRWQAKFDGEPIDIDRVWPVCAGSPISEEEYRRLVARREWAKQHAPASAYAEPGRKYDPLSSSTPIPF